MSAPVSEPPLPPTPDGEEAVKPCDQCGKSLAVEAFSATQWRKPSEARCRVCVKEAYGVGDGHKDVAGVLGLGGDGPVAKVLERTCDSCRKSLKKPGFSATQWRKSGEARCRACVKDAYGIGGARGGTQKGNGANFSIMGDLSDVTFSQAGGADQGDALTRQKSKELSGSKVRPNNWGYTTYIDRVFAMDCFPDMVQKRVFPDAKDISESMGALQVERRLQAAVECEEGRRWWFAVGVVGCRERNLELPVCDSEGVLATTGGCALDQSRWRSPSRPHERTHAHTRTRAHAHRRPPPRAAILTSIRSTSTH